MNPLSETESEPDQNEPVVETLEKPKRKYTKKVKVVTEPVAEPVAPKPKRVMSEAQLKALSDAREKRKLAKAKPEPLEPEPLEPEPEKKKRAPRKPKEAKEVVVKEIHHHYAEPKKEKAPRKPRAIKEELKQAIQLPVFV